MKPSRHEIPRNDAEVEAVASRDTAEEQRRRAEEETRTALSRELGGRVDRLLLDGHYDLALLVGVEANDIKQTYEARNALLAALRQSPAALLYPDNRDADPASALAVIPDGSAIAAAYGDTLVALWDAKEAANGPVVVRWRDLMAVRAAWPSALTGSSWRWVMSPSFCTMFQGTGR